MANLLDLAERMNLLRDELESHASDIAVKVATVMMRDLVSHTPVDVTTAMSNWQVQLHSPASGIIPAHNPGERGSTQGMSAETTLRLAASILSAKQPGESIWISNNVTYIEDLDRGTSKQEPAGFFERAALLGRKTVESYGRKL